MLIRPLPVGLVNSESETPIRRMSLGPGANLNGFVPFPSTSLWNSDISSSPVDPNSANIINFIGATVALHPDFGAGTFQHQTIGIPYQVVAGIQPKVNVKLGLYASESDPGPQPIPANALIEGYPKPGNGDRHVMVLDKDGCWLYELFHGAVSKSGAWSADSAAIWDLTINQKHPYTWTSADAAGLPVFVGLARHEKITTRGQVRGPSVESPSLLTFRGRLVQEPRLPENEGVH